MAYARSAGDNVEAATVGTGDPFNFTWATGGDAYANPDEGATTGTIDRACAVLFISVAANGAWVKVGSAEYHLRPNSFREIGLLAASGVVIVAKNLTAGSNFSDLKLEVR